MGFGGSSGGSNGNIADSTDVALNSVANDQVLAYNSSVSKWQNKTLASATTMRVIDSNGQRKQPYVVSGWPASSSTLSSAGVSPETHFLVRTS